MCPRMPFLASSSAHANVKQAQMQYAGNPFTCGQFPLGRKNELAGCLLSQEEVHSWPYHHRLRASNDGRLRACAKGRPKRQLVARAEILCLRKLKSGRGAAFLSFSGVIEAYNWRDWGRQL